MDLSLLPTSDYDKERTATRFTIRSANSPSYSLSRRPGVRKREEAGECHANGTNKEEDSGYQARTRSRVQGQSEEKETKLNQNSTADKTTPEVETNRESESRGRTEWRRNNLSSRSRSLDWRAGVQSPDRATKRGRDVSKWAAGLEEGKEVKDGTTGRVTSSLQGYNSAGASGIRDWKQQTLDRNSRGQTLPSRLRLTETSSSVGPKGGQSILERIQKLFGSAGFGKDSPIPETIGGTFPSQRKNSGNRKETFGLRLAKKETTGNDSDEFGKYSKLKSTLEIPLNGGAERRSRKFYLDEADLVKVSSPEETNEKETSDATAQKTAPSEITSPVSDDDKTPTDTPNLSPFISPAEDATPTADKTENESTSISTPAVKPPAPDSLPLPHPLASSSHSNLPDLVSPDVKTSHSKGMKRVMDLNAWVAGLSPDFKGWNDNEDYEDDEDDDESTQKDEDSNYDSDSGESSVTVTSNMSQSDRRSFCMSLADLCNFAGADYESENDSDEWQSMGRRSASLSSDVSALSCVSVLPTEELDKLLEDVRSLGDDTLQDYDEVQVVVLHKEVGVGLGFSLAGGVDQNKPITVHKVFHSGVAAQEGSIREGDHVLSINGTALSGSGHWEALRVLRRAKTREMAVVVLRRGDVSGASKKEVQRSPQGPTHTQTGQRMCLQLQKNSRDLGFSLQGGEGSNLGNRPLTVQKIFQGGPVDQVCPGDEVLEIGGVSMLGMRRLEAWTLIRRLPAGPVDVVLRRPPKHLET
uniref:Uncharacterized LOC110970176 n=1 Tax=Acanthochromis polyacanthus TaxID=80966 RepID=A0A3Q1G325_9TELE